MNTDDLSSLKLDKEYNPIKDFRKYGRVKSTDIKILHKLPTSEVRVKIHELPRLKFLLNDIGASGISVYCTADIVIDSNIYGVSFELGDYGFNSSARFIRAQEFENTKLYGMRFHKLSEKNFDFLKNLYIEKTSLKRM